MERMQTSNNLLQIEQLTTSFFTRKGTATAVDGVSLHIPRGKTVGLVGESGCGKSMTAMSVMRLVPPPGKVVSGRILLGDEDLLGLSKRQMRAITGNRVSMIFQEPMTSLNPVKTCGHQVREAILLHQNVSKAEAKTRVIEVFHQVGIPEPERRYDSYPHQLSGGLRQRVMIGMAMVCSPDLLIADEPTTALDVTIEAQILRLMKALQRQRGTSILMITHNLGVVAEICDSVYVMYAGQVVEYADVFQLFREPCHPYTIGLIESLPSTKVDDQLRLKSIPGMVPSLLRMPKGCRFAPRCEHATERCKEHTPELYPREDGHLVRCFRFGPQGSAPA